MIRKKLEIIRKLMEEAGIDAYYISSADYHESEYIGEHFKVRGYITGFQGSNGNLVITKNHGALWTDSRYENQVRQLLDGSGIEIYNVVKENTISPKEWIAAKLNNKGTLGFDGRTVSAKLGKEFKEYLEKKNIVINDELDIVDEFWKNRPSLSQEKIYYLDESYSGELENIKIEKIRQEIIKNDADYNIITALDDIAWILNMRGGDIKNTPVFLAYLIVGLKEIVLYVDLNKIKLEDKKRMEKIGISLKEYKDFYFEVKNLKKGTKILVDTGKISYSLFNSIKDKNVIDILNPSTMLKTIKNSKEIENIKNIHIKDAVAVTKFVYWLKNSIGKDEIDEIIAQEKMDSLREEQVGFIEPSFGTISAYGPNAAMPHYSATTENFSKLESKELYLVDSGGQYMGGTTDITRTIALGEISEKIKRDYTLVLKGMINLSMAKFLHGTTGSNLDICARLPMWNYGVNYAHGTGHGIGYMLGVHEGPQSLRISHSPYHLVPGMILTNEPGIYVLNSHGIRIENEMLVTPFIESDSGKFYQFETLTYVPIDIEPIIVEMLTAEEKEFLNNYHEKTYNKIAQYLTESERVWLKHSTRKLF